MQYFGICVPFWNEIAYFNGPPITLRRTLQKLHSNWMKNKTFKILEICTFLSLSVKFISQTVNPSTNCIKFSIQFIQQQNQVKIERKGKIA